MPPLSAIQSQLREHEQWLIGLRHDSCMTLAKIQTELEIHKGLKASPNQLETYFRNLGQRKNLSRPDWIAVFRALDSQKAFGRIFDVYISGRPIKEQELRKKRKNAKPVQPLASCLADADRLLSQLPDRVAVKLHQPQDASGNGTQHNAPLQPNSRPDFSAHQDVSASMPVDRTLSGPETVLGPSAAMHGTDASPKPPGPAGFEPASRSVANRAQLTITSANMETTTDQIPRIPPNLDFQMTSPAYELNFDHMDLEMFDGIPYGMTSPFVPGSWTGGLSSFDFQFKLHPQDLIATQNSIASAELNFASPPSATPLHSVDDLSLVESARLFLEDARFLGRRREMSATHKPMPTVGELIDNLQSLVLVETSEEVFSGPLDGIGRFGLFTDRFLQLFLFSIVNNFAGIEAIPAKVIINFISQHEHVRSRILSQLKGVSTILSRALVEKLLDAAIEAGDTKTVHDLLKLGIGKIDDIVCTYSGLDQEYPNFVERAGMTTLEKASTLRHFDIVGLLLQFGADVNKTYQDNTFPFERGPVEFAIGTFGHNRPIDHKVVDLLINNGATVSGRLVDTAIHRGDTPLIEKLMSVLPSSEHVYFFSEVSTLVMASENLRNDMSLRVIQQVIHACRDTHDSTCINSNRKLLANTMARASRRKNKELVQLLIPHGDQDCLDTALTAASRSGRHSLVQLLLAHGAHGDAPACDINIPSPNSDGYTSIRTTPLAEAIRGEDAELVGIFAKEGAWDHIGEHGRLEAAMHAIAESGNLAYFWQVLHLVPNPKPQALGTPLSAAIMARHEEVALRLIEAGADVNKRERGSDYESPLIAALQTKSQAITWALLDSDVHVNVIAGIGALQVATAWGDPQIIKALVFMGANINDCRHKLPLTVAVEAGDRSLVELLISLGAHLNAGIGGVSSPLAAAALVGDAETANYLLDRGANSADEVAILHAISHDRRLLDIILQKFRKQYPKGHKGFGGGVLYHALQTHDEAVLDVCLNSGFDVNHICYPEGTKTSYGHRPMTALGHAIKQYPECPLNYISKLLDSGANVNVPVSQWASHQFSADGEPSVIEERETALLQAMETKSLPLVELLISRGADVRREAKLGLKRTPLQKACEVGSHTIVDLLLQHNVDVNASPAARHGATALQLAAKAGSTRIAKRLLDLGATVNAPGVRVGGRSAIEYAAEYGRLSMIQVLWDAASGKFAAGQHESAISLAQKQGHSACAMLLRNLLSHNQGLIDVARMEDDGRDVYANVIV